jgi:hypothetical protein
MAEAGVDLPKCTQRDHISEVLPGILHPRLDTITSQNEPEARTGSWPLECCCRQGAPRHPLKAGVV